jgi:hypothetical protein
MLILRCARKNQLHNKKNGHKNYPKNYQYVKVTQKVKKMINFLPRCSSGTYEKFRKKRRGSDINSRLVGRRLIC